MSYTGCGCSCGCGGGSVYPYYSPYARYYPVTYAYPVSSYVMPYYGLPVGYVYDYPTVPMCGCEVTARYPRGEYRVGNCLMICQ